MLGLYRKALVHPHPLLMPLVNRIKEFVDSRGITPYRFAQETGITSNTVYALYHNPNQRVGAAVLEKICATYKVQPNKILVWIEQPEEGKEGMSKG